MLLLTHFKVLITYSKNTKKTEKDKENEKRDRKKECVINTLRC